MGERESELQQQCQLERTGMGPEAVLDASAVERVAWVLGALPDRRDCGICARTVLSLYQEGTPDIVGVAQSNPSARSCPVLG
jgi:hypothetical protein